MTDKIDPATLPGNVVTPVPVPTPNYKHTGIRFKPREFAEFFSQVRTGSEHFDIQCVREFHNKFGVPSAAPGETNFNEDSNVRRFGIVGEEVKEIKQALEKKNRPLLADALGDTLYVSAGSEIEWGLGRDLTWDEIRIEFEGALNEVMTDLEQVVNAGDVSGTKRVLLRLRILCKGLASELGIPLLEVFRNIHESNMSKLLPDGQVIRNEIGKIIKPLNYVPAEPGQVIMRGEQRTAGTIVPGE